jgi:iron complex outermembrane receptor protein
MMGRTAIRNMLAASAAAAPLLFSVAHAASSTASTVADAGAVPIQEIVVTATKTAQKVSKVPISISAYSRTQMDTLGVKSVDDIVRLTPGLTLTQRNPSTTIISIRGIESPVGAGTTGIYIDDTPIQVRNIGYFPNNTYPEIFDLDRVEVLRGPQGTLFGSSSEGGAVRFITPSPSLNKYSVYARAEASGTQDGSPSYETGVAVGGPIVQDVLGFRVSAWARHDGGWIDRVNDLSGALVQPDANYQDAYVLRGAVTWAPTPRLRITPAIYYQAVSRNDTDLNWSTLSNPSDGRFESGAPLHQPSSDRFVLPTLKLEYDFGGVLFTSNTSYFERESRVKLDYSTVVPSILSGNTAIIVPGYTSLTNEIDKQQNWSEEARLQSSDPNARLNWVAGVYLARQRQSAFEGIGGQDTNFLSETLFGVPTLAAFGSNNVGIYSFIGTNSAVDTEVAGFGEVNYALTPQLKLTAGVRVSREEFKFANYQTGPFNTGTTQAQNAKSDTPVTPKVSLTYQVTHDTLVYATAAEGYREGGGNAQLPVSLCAAALSAIGSSGAPETYNSDSLWSYEGGAKGKLFDGRLQYEASGFYIDWKNIQQQVQLTRCGFEYVANLGGATSAGFDLQAQLRATDDLTLGLAVGYDDAHYTSTIYPGAVHSTGPNSVLVSSGDTLGNAPWTVTVTGEYDFDLFGAHGGYLNGTYLYTSHNNGRSAYLNPESVSYDPGLPNLPAASLVNLRLGDRFNNWDMSVFANNVLGASTIVARYDETVGNPIVRYATERPRVVGVTASYRY